MKFTFSDNEYIIVCMIVAGADIISCIKAYRKLCGDSPPGLADSKQAIEALKAKCKVIDNNFNKYMEWRRIYLNTNINPCVIPKANIEI